MISAHPFLEAPLFDINLTADLKKIIDESGHSLCAKKKIVKYDHTKYEQFENYIDPGMPQDRQQLKTVQYAISCEEGADGASAQTILYFLKLLRDSDAKLVCIFRKNRADLLPDIVLRDTRKAKPNFESEHPWEALTYTFEDVQNLSRMCRFYFDVILPALGKEGIYFPIFNAINYSRLAFTSSFNDLRLCVPPLAIGLESLFSYDTTEVAHKIGENIAWFLRPDNPVERKDLYDGFKCFYDLRSRIVHGDNPRKTLQKGKEIYLFALDIIRETVIKILDKQEALDIFKNNQSKKEYFSRLVLGFSR